MSFHSSPSAPTILISRLHSFYSRRRSKIMRCPYCNTEYTHEHPCFCHPSFTTAPAEDQQTLSSEPTPDKSVPWNSHRGVRLD